MKPVAALEHLPPPDPESVGQRLVYWQYRAAWEAAARAPGPVARRLPARLGAAWHAAADRRQRQQVRRNLARVQPDIGAAELDELVRAAYVSYARYWLDSFRLHTMDAAQVIAASTAEGFEHVDAFRDSGRGGIFATGHIGSWDVGAFWTAQRDWRMVVVAELVEPRRLFDRFVELRRGAGIDVVPLVKGGDMLDRLEQRVRDEAALATLLADRDLTGKGPIVSFFGEPCRLPPGTAALARRTGRPVVIGGFMTAGDGFHGVVQQPVELHELSIHDGTQVVAHELERLIRRFPDQWHVFNRNWLADREPEHPVVAAWRAGEDWQALARAERSASGPTQRPDAAAQPSDTTATRRSGRTS